MDFSALIQSMREPTQEKTAADTTAKTADTAAKDALNTALEKTAGAPAASSTDAVDVLMKTAAALAEQEKQAELVHASQIGRAIGDAILETFASADAQAKIAMAQQPAVQPQQDPQTENLVKQAAEAGYRDTMEKVAAEQYAAGQEAALDAVYKTAAEEFLKGDAEVETLVRMANAR